MCLGGSAAPTWKPPEQKVIEPGPESPNDKVSTRKKQALEIKKTKEGVKTLGAIDPSAEITQDAGIAPTSGINTPT